MSVKEDLDGLPKNPDDFTRRQHILAILSDEIGDLLYYDRKRDCPLGAEGIPEALKAGEITIEEMVEAFDIELRKGLKKMGVE